MGKMKYETPELETTRFEPGENIMEYDYGENGGSGGDVVTTYGTDSVTDPGDLGLDW